MPDMARAIIAQARVAELESATGATGYTILKFRRTPVDDLVSSGRIGPLELQAAVEVQDIFAHLTRDLGYLRADGIYRDRQHRAWVDDAPPRPEEVDAWHRYKQFMNHWSAKKKQHGDLALPILVAAVVDQRPWDHIAQEHGLSVSQTRCVVVHALRDYAARAGWANRKWKRNSIARACSSARRGPPMPIAPSSRLGP